MQRRVVTTRLLSALVAAVTLGRVAIALAVCGDANGDGRVTVSDGVQTLRAAADLSSSCDSDCDFDGSGTITVSDGVNVLRKAADLPVVERCPNAGNPVSTILGHTIDLFGPITKIGAVGGATVGAAASPCDNAGGGFQQTSDGFTFDDCDIGNVNFTGFLGTANGSLDFENLTVRRRGDVVGLTGSLSVGDAGGNPELSGVLNGQSQQLGRYVVTLQQVVTGSQGKTLDGTLDFDTSDSRIVNVVEIQVTLTGGTSLPVVVRFTDDSTRNFSYDTGTEVLTPRNGPVPTPTATPLPATQVRLSNIDDRITAFLNGKQVLQAQSTGAGATQDTGFVEVDGLTCGDNLFEFRVENTVPGSGYTFHVQLQVGGGTIVDRSCGTVGVQGCNGNDQTQGEVVRDQTYFCLPCAPCTGGAGTCANPVSIPATGLATIHGSVTGASGVAAPCGGPSGPESVFRFTPSATGCYEFSTCGTSFDSELAVDNAVCGGTPSDCHDGDGACADGSTHELTFGFFDGGQPLTVLLDDKQSSGGTYTLDVRPSGRCIL